MMRLETFGGLTLTDSQGERPQPRRRIALLARLAAADARGVGRDELLALFWPERDLDSARHSLDQLLYEARRALGASPAIGTATLRLDTSVVTCDLTEWRSALARDDPAAAVLLYRGPFLQGFYLNASPEFEPWVETTRGELAADYRQALETLATRASADGSIHEAVAWWRRLAAEDRYGSRIALGLMRALADAGDHARALEFFHVHERILRTELETAPDLAVSTFAGSLRDRPALPPAAGARSSPPPALSRLDSIDFAPPVATTAPLLRRTRLPAWKPLSVALFAAVLLVAAALRGAPAHMAHGNRARSNVPAAPVPHIGYETTNIAAHELFERGRDPVLLRSDSGVHAAIRYLQQAVTLDTNYARAYAALASRCATAAWGISLPIADRPEMRARAEAAARRAIALDDSLADAHAGLGYVLGMSYKEPASLAELERAVALDSTQSSTYETLAKSFEWLGRPNDAIAAARRAVRADPLSPGAYAELGNALYFARRYDDALTELAKVAAIQPPLRRVREYTATVYAATGQWSEALAILEPGAKSQPHSRGLLGYVLARSGARDEAKQVLAGMLDESAGLAPAEGIAEVYVGLGEYDRAFAWLDRAFDDFSLRADIMGPLFDELRADHRFERVRRRLGLAPM